VKTYRIYIKPYDPRASVVISSVTNRESTGKDTGDGGIMTCICEEVQLYKVVQALETSDILSLEKVVVLP